MGIDKQVQKPLRKRGTFLDFARIITFNRQGNFTDIACEFKKALNSATKRGVNPDEGAKQLEEFFKNEQKSKYMGPDLPTDKQQKCRDVEIIFKVSKKECLDIIAYHQSVGLKDPITGQNAIKCPRLRTKDY